MAEGITITEKAKNELKQIMVEQNKTEAALRVWVSGGGCSGLSYGMAIDDGKPEENDKIYELDGVKVYVDGLSIQYMGGSTVDFVEDSMGGGFKIDNPQATSSCGCGSSFQTAGGDAPTPPPGGCGGCPSAQQ